MKLILLNDDETEALRMDVGDVDLKRFAVAVIQATDANKPKKPRSDKGKSRTKAEI